MPKYMPMLLGHDLEKVYVIQNVKPPNNVGDIRRFVGLVNHLSKFASNLAKSAKLLQELICKKVSSEIYLVVITL